MSDLIYLLTVFLTIGFIFRSISQYRRKKREDRQLEIRHKQIEEKVLKELKERKESRKAVAAAEAAEQETRMSNKTYIQAADSLPSPYHINLEGKIYPCRARVFPCSYKKTFHSTSKLELFQKILIHYGVDSRPCEHAMKELKTYNRLRDLQSLSSTIEQAAAPVDVIVATLKKVLSHMLSVDLKTTIIYDSESWKAFEDNLAERVYLALVNGFEMELPDYIPDKVLQKGRMLFGKRRRGIIEDLASMSRNSAGLRTLRAVEMDYRNGNYQKYENHKKRVTAYYELGLTGRNFDESCDLMTVEFMRFSHDLNVSKIITQPVFYGDLDEAREAIRNMDAYELLSTYDDYSVSDAEIESYVKEANYFVYEHRRDLSFSANAKLSEWYDRNKEIYENWKIHTPKRVLLLMEIVQELKRRNLKRQDSVVGQMIAENKWG